MPKDDQPPRFRVGGQTVVVGDCQDFLAARGDRSIDLVVTSPPYNIGLRYNHYSDQRPRHEYLSWMLAIATQLRRVLTETGSIFLNVGATSIDPWIATDVANVFRRRFVLQNHILWVKSISVGDDTVGHFKPINSRRYLNNNHESVFHFTKGGTSPIDRLSVGVPFKDKSNIARWGHDRDKRCAGNAWFIPYETVRSRKQKHDHPAGFPEELARRCMLMHGNPDGIVLDPFLGAGTSLVAAERLGMSGFGCEVDEVYAGVALERLAALHG